MNSNFIENSAEFKNSFEFVLSNLTNDKYQPFKGVYRYFLAFAMNTNIGPFVYKVILDNIKVVIEAVSTTNRCLESDINDIQKNYLILDTVDITLVFVDQPRTIDNRSNFAKNLFPEYENLEELINWIKTEKNQNGPDVEKEIIQGYLGLINSMIKDFCLSKKMPIPNPEINDLSQAIRKLKEKINQ